jgi:hypothetical protein
LINKKIDNYKKLIIKKINNFEKTDNFEYIWLFRKYFDNFEKFVNFEKFDNFEKFNNFEKFDNFDNFDKISQFWPNFVILTKFHSSMNFSILTAYKNYWSQQNWSFTKFYIFL